VKQQQQQQQRRWRLHNRSGSGTRATTTSYGLRGKRRRQTRRGPDLKSTCGSPSGTDGFVFCRHLTTKTEVSADGALLTTATGPAAVTGSGGGRNRSGGRGRRAFVAVGWSVSTAKYTTLSNDQRARHTRVVRGTI